MVICVAPRILEDPTWVLSGESILFQCVAQDALPSGSNAAVYYTLWCSVSVKADTVEVFRGDPSGLLVYQKAEVIRIKL